MGRSAKFDSGQILDAALEIVAERGPAAATMAAIAAWMGAPVGSIYHRFATRDLLLAELWIRGIGRFQQGLIEALEADDAESVVLHTVRWCRENPAEAAVLLLYRKEDLAAQWPEELGDRLAGLNAAAQAAFTAFARRRDAEPDWNRLVFALIDVPLGAVRRHITDRNPPPPWVDDLVLTASKAVLLGAECQPGHADLPQ
ncbi:TetR/AcrR family transcriptional regulator [Nonomuraea jabiensis]|uniref:TetR/AcrR family transcriptional regulator n=1 Tax=Nonomuraea jabiensis TaxID=882448 RepID=UPI003D75BCFF